jgi:hypothetical protein
MAGNGPDSPAPHGESGGQRSRGGLAEVKVDGHRLSSSEQRILGEIETMLARDRGLDRQLRTLRVSARSRCADGLRGARPWILTCLALASVALLVTMVRLRVPGPGLVAAFAGTWSVTLALAAVTLISWCRRTR